MRKYLKLWVGIHCEIFFGTCEYRKRFSLSHRTHTTGQQTNSEWGLASDKSAYSLLFPLCQLLTGLWWPPCLRKNIGRRGHSWTVWPFTPYTVINADKGWEGGNSFHSSKFQHIKEIAGTWGITRWSTTKPHMKAKPWVRWGFLHACAASLINKGGVWSRREDMDWLTEYVVPRSAKYLGLKIAVSQDYSQSF